MDETISFSHSPQVTMGRFRDVRSKPRFAPVVTISQFGLGVFSVSQFTIAGFALAQIGIAYSLIARIGIFLHQGRGQLVWSVADIIRRLR